MPPPSPPALALIPTALTTVAAVSAWAGDGTPPSAALAAIYTRLINNASRAFLGQVSRSTFLVHAVNEVRTGMDTNSMMLKDWPVLGDLTSLTVRGVTIPKQTSFGGLGWVLDGWDGYTPGDPHQLSLVGRCFPRDPGGVTISYTAGYATMGEVQTVDSTGYVWPMSPQGRFAADWKVLDASGATMIPTISPTPAVGSYVAPTSDQLPYQFNPAQGQVTLNYSFIPADVDQVISKWVGEWVKYKGRIGEKSRSLGGQESITYDLGAMPQDAMGMTKQYNAVLTI